MSEKTIPFGDVQAGDEIAIEGLRVLVTEVEPDPDTASKVIVHYQRKGIQMMVARSVDRDTTLYDRPAVEEEPVLVTDLPWSEVRVGHTVLVAAHGPVVITKIEDPTTDGATGKSYSFVDSDGKERSVRRVGHHTTDRTIVPGEVIEDGETVIEDDAVGGPEVVLAGELTAKYLERRITFRYDSTLGFDTTVHAAELIGYSVHLKDVRLYLRNDQGVDVPVNVQFDQIICIHPKEK